MSTQAKQVMLATVETSLFIDPSCFNGSDVLNGLIAEGGALWLKAQEAFPTCYWDLDMRQITFDDGSAIQFVSRLDLSFNTTYKAV